MRSRGPVIGGVAAVLLATPPLCHHHVHRPEVRKRYLSRALRRKRSLRRTRRAGRSRPSLYPSEAPTSAAWVGMVGTMPLLLSVLSPGHAPTGSIACCVERAC